MKVLLDENLDHALRKLLGKHDVVSVAFMGWGGLKNGELLRIAEDTGIDVLLTGDQTLALERSLPAAVWRLLLSRRLSCRSSKQLKGRLRGFWSVRVRANWRIIFRFEGEDAFEVELIDYH